MSLGLTEYSYSRVLVCEINSTQLCSAAVSAGDESKKIVERKDETTDLTTKLPETQGTEFESNNRADKTDPRHTPTVLGASHCSSQHARPGSL